MNERIRELEAQCWEPKQYGPPWFNSQKFAQLIVEECAAIALKSGNINNKSMQAKVEAERIYHKIKEHFGVEE
jgi:isocitrate lyase